MASIRKGYLQGEGKGEGEGEGGGGGGERLNTHHKCGATKTTSNLLFDSHQLEKEVLWSAK